MELCTILKTRVLYLENTKTSQQLEIDSLKMRAKKLEKKQRSRTHKLKRLYKVGLTARVEPSNNKEGLGEDASKHERRIDDINADKDITLVNVQDDEMFDVIDLGGKEVFVEQVVVAKKANDEVNVDTTQVTTKEITLAQALVEIKTSKPKVKGIVFHEPEYDGIQAKIDADYQWAERLQAQEQEKLSIKEKATLFKELLEQRRKHFTAKIVEEKRKKPPTQAQQRKIMCTYLTNVEGKKLKDLKNKSFDQVNVDTTQVTTKEITLAQALVEIKTSKPKVKGIVFHEPETAKRLQAEFDEEERLAREKAKKEQEANVALIKEYDGIQAKIDADYQWAERLQAQEQE
nr:hypothetical protein [Tanacetum cinerariifolium]